MTIQDKRNDAIMAEVRAAQAAYAREWRKKNPEKQAEISRRYWLKKAREMQEQASNTDTNEKNKGD